MVKIKFRLLKNFGDIKAGTLVEDVEFTSCWIRKDMNILSFHTNSRKVTKVVTGDMNLYVRRVV